jgi:hypothetical protein
MTNSLVTKGDDPETPYHTPSREMNQFSSPDSTLTKPSLETTDDAYHQQQNQLIITTTTTTSNIPQTPSMLVVLDDAANFAETVKQKTRQRREQEDAALASIKVQTKRLEAALTAEIKRRVDAVQQFQIKASVEIKRVEDKLLQQMQDDRAIAEDRLNALETRMAALECKWQADVNSTQQEFARTAHQLQEQIAELKSQTQNERQSRLEREEGLTQQIEQLSNEYKELWQAERQERTLEIQKLTEKSVADDMVRVESERSVDHRISQELKELQEEITLEQQEREQADHEIVAGLNRYMETVQASLAYVSGV